MKLENIYQTNTKFTYLQNKHNSLWSFSPVSELSTILRLHVICRQVLSTVDWQPSPVDHTQRPVLCTARRRLGVMQCIAWSVGVSQDLSIMWLCSCQRYCQQYRLVSATRTSSRLLLSMKLLVPSWGTYHRQLHLLLILCHVICWTLSVLLKVF